MSRTCEMCFNQTIFYIHSTTRYFEKLTGRHPYLYRDRRFPYIVCAKCYATIKRLREILPHKSVITNDDIRRYEIMQLLPQVPLKRLKL